MLHVGVQYLLGKLKLGDKWKDNIKTDLINVMREGLSWVDLCQGKDNWWTVLNTVTKCRVA